MMNLDGAQMLDRTFSLNVDDVFNMIFFDSPFFQSLLAKRNTYNITVGEWTDIDTNNVSDYLKEYKQYRNLSYTMDVNQSMAKTVSTAEVQYLYASSTPGQAYVIKSEAANMGFPLSSSFRFDTVYYLSRGETENKCNLQIYGKIVSRKNGCGIKSLIEDSTIQGLSTYVEDLTRSLLQLTEPDLKNINISNSSSFLSKESIPPITEPIFVTRDRIIAGEKSLSLRIRSLSTSSSSLSHFELYYETNMNLDEAKLLTSNATLADIEKRLASGRGFETCIITRSGMENLVVTAAKSYKKIGTYTFPVGTTPILGETIVRELDPDEIMSTFGSS